MHCASLFQIRLDQLEDSRVIRLNWGEKALYRFAARDNQVFMKIPLWFLPGGGYQLLVKRVSVHPCYRAFGYHGEFYAIGHLAEAADLGITL